MLLRSIEELWSVRFILQCMFISYIVVEDVMPCFANIHARSYKMYTFQSIMNTANKFAERIYKHIWSTNKCSSTKGSKAISNQQTTNSSLPLIRHRIEILKPWKIFNDVSTSFSNLSFQNAKGWVSNTAAVKKGLWLQLFYQPFRVFAYHVRLSLLNLIFLSKELRAPSWVGSLRLSAVAPSDDSFRIPLCKPSFSGKPRKIFQWEARHLWREDLEDPDHH